MLLGAINLKSSVAERLYNREYDYVLTRTEENNKKIAQDFYKAMFALLASDPEAFEVAFNEDFSLLIEDIYNTTYRSFAPWYVSSFSQLSGVESNLVVELARPSGSDIQARVAAIAFSVRQTILKLGEAKDVEAVSDSLASRLSVTETNGVAGLAVASTAQIMFPSSETFKKWITVGDERVRASHLDVGSRKPIRQDELYRVGSSYMRFPSDPQAFGMDVPSQVINCRCRSIILPQGRTSLL